VGHGFIRALDSQCSNEVDVLVSDSVSNPPYFNEGGLQIVPPEAVLAAIEVKTTFTKQTLRQALERQVKTHTLFRQSSSEAKPWQGVFFYATPESRSPSSILDTVKNEITTTLEINSQFIEEELASGLSFVLPIPTCVVLSEECLLLFRDNQEERKLRIDLFDTKQESFSRAAIDLLAYISDRVTSAPRMTAIEATSQMVSSEVMCSEIISF
jgi:hypothetical protein